MGSFREHQKNNFRKNRLEHVLFEIISEMVTERRFKDPSLSEVDLSITRIECSDDLRYANAYFSLLRVDRPFQPEIDQILAGFRRASGYVRQVVRKEINLFQAPEIIFSFDETLHEAERVWEMIDHISESGSIRSVEGENFVEKTDSESDSPRFSS